jgi:tricorn protease
MKQKVLFLLIILFFATKEPDAQPTRLLRQPTVSSGLIAFTYGGDIWISDFSGAKITRITSTPALESNPFLSPDGKQIAFTSNRSGTDQAYVVSAEGGEPL